jgi:hypothetical protein
LKNGTIRRLILHFDTLTNDLVPTTTQGIKYTVTQSTQSSSGFSRKEQIIVISLIIIGLVLIIFFGLRAVRSYIRIQQTGLEPGVTDVEAIRGWMTIPYIATAYDVPEEYIFEQIGIPSEGNQNKSLRQLTRQYATGERGAILTAVKESLRRYQAENPPPAEPGHD